MKDYRIPLQRAKEAGITDVIVALSGGRDSVVVLDLCKQHFKRVEAFFMYSVKGLSFQEKYLRYLEKRYDMEVMRMPHWCLTTRIKDNVFRHPTKRAAKVKPLTVKDIFNAARRRTGLRWIATGEKVSDSIQRLAQIRNKNFVNDVRGVIYPVANFNDREIKSYLLKNNIQSSPEYDMGLDGNRSFGGLNPNDMKLIRDKFPSDFEKIKKFYPLIEAQLIRADLLCQKQSNGRDSNQEESTEVN